jgi:hypothetical protein
VSTSEGEEHLPADATPTPADAASDPLAEVKHDELTSSGGEPTVSEPLAAETVTAEAAEEKPAEETAEEPAEKQPGFFARMAESTSPYTVLLWIALVALIAGTAFLAFELQSYNWQMKAKVSARSMPGVLHYQTPAGPNALG